MTGACRLERLLLLECLLLVACSGGGSASMTPAPSGLTYPSPPPFTIANARAGACELQVGATCLRGECWVLNIKQR